MNFFGHAVVAGWFEREPRYVLGSMLPDFATMSGTRLSMVADAQVAEGVALHHRTDDAFHSAPAFLELSGLLREALEQREVGWGTARAVAHVGTELLLDGVLLTRHESEPYLSALEVAHAIVEREPQALGFRDQGAGFEQLLGRLREAGPPHAYREPARVAEFLERALSRRPRLCFQHGDRTRVAEVLATYAPEVERQTDRIMAHLAHHEVLRSQPSHVTTVP